MQRINVCLDDTTYNLLRAISFQRRKPMSEIVRSSLHDSFQESKKDAQLILEAEDEKALLEIIKQDKYIDWNELKEKHNLK